MSDVPTHRNLDPASIQREKQAKAASPLYWCSETVTVYMYKAMNRAQQDEVNRQCRQIEQDKRK